MTHIISPTPCQIDRACLTVACQRLLPVFRELAFSFGDFTLASGKKSAYYINSKKALLSSRVAPLLGEALYAASHELDFDAAGGLEVGAIPMAALLAAACGNYDDVPVEGFFVRKEAKDHGSKSLVEGNLRPGMKALILEDVTTTGASALKAIAAVEALGASVVAVLTIVDRREGAAEAFAGKYAFYPLFTIEDFLPPPPPAAG